MNKSCLLFLFFLLISFRCENRDHATFRKQKEESIFVTPVSQPSFQVDYRMPTADKPQSKLWFMDGYWWALLPNSSGPSLWQRKEEGWLEHTEITEALRGVPGRADVWADGNHVTAVGVADLSKTNYSLTVFRLSKKSSSIEWKTEILAELFPPSPEYAIETATIVQDGKGNWWIAAVADTKVCVWNSPSCGKKWSHPIVLAEGIDNDDICVVTTLPDNEVGVIWSDQIRDAVLIRIHKDGDPAENWGKEEIIDKGNLTADNHFNTSLAPDGTLWIATKNEVDVTDKPQFVLRIRSADGKWTNMPYVIREEMKRPSRPIVIATEDNSYVFSGYGDNDRSIPFPHNSQIIFGIVDTTLSMILYNPQVVISPDTNYKNLNHSYAHNVTGPRHPFPVNAPWIILASDQEGRVYEADLRKLVFKP